MMRRIVRLGMAAAVLAAFSVPSFAMVSYAYMGTPFTSSVDDTGVGFPYLHSPGDTVQGFIVLASALGGGLSDQTITPIDFRFSDGHASFTPASSSSHTFKLSTSPSGQITSWNIGLVGTSDAFQTIDGYYFLNSSHSASSSLDEAGATLYCCGSSGVNFLTNSASSTLPGKWNASIQSAVPEPAVLSLFGCGLLALFLYRPRYLRNTVAKQ